MKRLAVVARLKPGASAQAAELIAAGPPFDPEGVGLARHTVYLSANDVVFVFEGPQVEWIVDGIVDDPFRSPVFDAWSDLLDGSPKAAREAYSWERSRSLEP